MKYVGAHVSIAGGAATAPARAKDIGANAFGMFTKNQRQWRAKPLSDDEVARFHSGLAEAGICGEHVVVHDGYLINIGNPDPEKRLKSLTALADEAGRVERLGLTLLNFHPGSGMGMMDERETIKLIAEGVNTVLAGSKSAVLLIESTAGQGAHVGYRFEHLASLIELIEPTDRIGVCIDTCHIFAAGYDLRTDKSYERTMSAFDSIVGFARLRAVHLNDAKIEFESRRDRHESLGEGHLGWTPFELIMNDPRFDSIPMILETPQPDRWKTEIGRLFSFVDSATNDDRA